MYDVSDLTAAAGTVLSLAKSLSSTANTLKNAKLGSIIIDLQSAMGDMQLKQQELISEIYRLSDENRKLNEMLEREKNIEYHHGAYWNRLDDGSLDGPFSQRKHDEENLLVRLRYYDRGNYDGKDAIQFKYRQQTGKDRIDEYCVVPVSFLGENKVAVLDEH